MILVDNVQPWWKFYFLCIAKTNWSKCPYQQATTLNGASIFSVKSNSRYEIKSSLEMSNIPEDCENPLCKGTCKRKLTTN